MHQCCYVYETLIKQNVKGKEKLEKWRVFVNVKNKECLTESPNVTIDHI
jgi:hypothetical protein